ncbi:hypothetical protein GHT06_017082 [Daphnia sinensis]|uniref:Uncharacterized protein n=1 Tax=Daphnia sinensis TaxID=1820382 RepID=A0AAD5KQD1_9CRUS|nr:hypothetical protein GHT06_017082 [Daphnia sinensis]
MNDRDTNSTLNSEEETPTVRRPVSVNNPPTTIPNLTIYFLALGEGYYADHGSSSDADVCSHEDSDKSVTELRTDVSLRSQVSDPTNKENKKNDKTKDKEPKGCKDITKGTPTTQDEFKLVCISFLPEMFKFIGNGRTPGSFVIKRQIGDCKRNNNTLGVYWNSRGNIMKHLKIRFQFSRHKDIIPNFNVSPLKGETKSYSGKKTSQQKISFDGYPRVLTQDSFDNYVVVSLNIFATQFLLYNTDRIEFSNFMKRLCPKLHMRHIKFYRKKIDSAFLRQKVMLKNELKTVDWFADDLTRRSACLAVKRIRGMATYDVIAKILEDIHDEFDITRKLTATIRDSGSNFVKAFKKNTEIPPVTTTNPNRSNVADNGMDEDCYGRGVIRNPTRYDGSDGAIAAMLEEFESDYESSDSSEDDEQEEASTNEAPDTIPKEQPQGVSFIPLTNVLNNKNTSSEYFSLPTHRRCACHTLNLVAKEDVVKQMQPAIWKKTKEKLESVRCYFDSLKMLFVIHNKTRWNSYFNALGRIILLVTEALDMLQADKKMSVGYLLPTLSILMKKLESLKTKPEIKHCKSMITTIMNLIKKRFELCFKDEELIIAALIHPTFKTSWFFGKQKTDTNELDLFLVDDSTDVLSLLKYSIHKKMFSKYNTALPSSASVYIEMDNTVTSVSTIEMPMNPRFEFKQEVGFHPRNLCSICSKLSHTKKNVRNGFFQSAIFHLCSMRKLKYFRMLFYLTIQTL